MTYLEDHGLPVIQLRERRRELVVALAASNSISAQQMSEIAVLQHAIVAIDTVLVDLDAEAVAALPAPRLRLIR
jgi:hypothetical protein